jgi:hypothetical protein
VLLSAVFVAEICIVALYKPGGVEFPPVQIWEQQQPQWSYGVASLLLVLAFSTSVCARNAFVAALEQELLVQQADTAAAVNHPAQSRGADVEDAPGEARRVNLKDLVSAGQKLRDTCHGRALGRPWVWVLCLVAGACMLGGSLFMYAITGSRVIPLVATLVPLLIATFRWTFISWRDNQYTILEARSDGAPRYWSVGEVSRMLGVGMSALLCWGIGIGIR